MQLIDTDNFRTIREIMEDIVREEELRLQPIDYTDDLYYEHEEYLYRDWGEG